MLYRDSAYILVSVKKMQGSRGQEERGNVPCLFVNTTARGYQVDYFCRVALALALFKARHNPAAL
jgi:hypothetical protein